MMKNLAFLGEVLLDNLALKGVKSCVGIKVSQQSFVIFNGTVHVMFH